MIVHDHNLRFDLCWSMSRRVVVAHFTWREKKWFIKLASFCSPLLKSQAPLVFLSWQELTKLEAMLTMLSHNHRCLRPNFVCISRGMTKLAVTSAWLTVTNHFRQVLSQICMWPGLCKWFAGSLTR